MSFIPDPLKLWRKAITELEGRGNALANRSMDTGEFASALHQMASLSLGMQQSFEKVLGVYLRRLNLPSRKDIAELLELMQRIETKLDALQPPPAPMAAVQRPARTRVPKPRVMPAVAAPEPAPAPARRKRKSGG